MLKYYNLAIIGSPLEPLTYHSQQELKLNSLVDIQLRNRSLKAIVLERVEKPTFETSEILEYNGYYLSQQQFKLAKFISSYYICSLGDAFALMVPYKENVEIKTQNSPHPDIEIKLSQKQQKALKFLQQHKVSLLFGDTGSGKTEIYMSYFQIVLKQNKQILFLMPEISLTPQMQERLQNHFGSSVVMWHSKLTPKNKKIALEKIYSNEAKIIAGPRSALFLPIKDLGLIVVDEEHDESYKSSSRPRYNARDIAIYMGKLYDVSVVLGSATPSLTSYIKFPHVRLKGGYFQKSKEFIYERNKESLSEFIIDQLQKNLNNSSQSILFIPTRANFKYLICEDCSQSVKCQFCSVGMSVHHATNSLRCHYCGFAQALPKLCPSCQSPHLQSSRLGTSQALLTLQERFNDANIEKFDKDSITTATKLKKALQRFNNKEIDILVGTQMLSKGHDYHDVTLAVILGIDNLLNMADYKAREKALSLVIQVAGRSGRAKDAKVIIQTFNEEFFETFIDNYEEFLEDEKFYREGLYPPYKKLCRILFADKKAQKAIDAMRDMEQKLKEFKDIEIIGAKRCAIERVANKYRFEILLRADKTTSLLKAIQATKHPLAEIDMDPVEFS